MKILYLDCGMGASGDMLMGALASLLDAPDAFERQMNALGLEHVSVSMEKSVKCGVVGNQSCSHGADIREVFRKGLLFSFPRLFYVQTGVLHLRVILQSHFPAFFQR